MNREGFGGRRVLKGRKGARIVAEAEGRLKRSYH